MIARPAGPDIFITLPVIASIFAGGCIHAFGSKPESSPGVEADVAHADQYAYESKTLSNLAALEIGVDDFIKTEGRIPDDLDQLIPKYIAEIPAVELGIPAHKDTNKVRYYPAGVIRDGVIDGTQIEDTGRWGYAHNDHQVIVYVDCVHQSSRKKSWYRERGVF